MKTLPIAICVALACAATSAARAQSSDRAKAAELAFQEGERLVRTGKIAAGCAKLEESDRLERGYGVLFNVADCHERLGRTATAWSEFREAEAIAVRAKQADRQKKAERRAAALEPKLVRIRVAVAAPPPDLAITRDGQPLDAALWGKAVPVDPGDHAIVASAPGRRSWTGSVTISDAGSTVTLSVPVLEMTSPEPAAPSSSSGLGAQRIAGIAVGALGVVGIGAGIGTAVAANGKWRRALDEHCNAARQCDPTGVSLADEALGTARASTATFVIGSLAAATSIVLFVTAPKGSAPRVGVAADRLSLAFDFE
jgi:hypothetical protein